jgi:hypothetical protein
VLHLTPLASTIEPIVSAFGTGVAEAQRQLDYVSIRLARVMGGLDPGAFSPPGEAPRGEGLPEPAFTGPSGRGYSLLELGLTPTFYHFAEAVLELRMALSTSEEVARTDPLRPKVKASLDLGPGRVGVRVQTISGTYSCRYQYAAQSSSKLRSRLVSIPAPAALEARIASIAARARAEGRPE